MTQGDEPAPLGRSARGIIDAARPHERLAADRKDRLRGSVMAAVGAGAAVGLAAGAAKAAKAAGAGASLGAGAAKAAGLSLFAKIGIGVAVATIGAGGVLWSRAQQESSRPAATVSAAASDSALASNGAGEPPRRAPSTEPSSTTEPAVAAPESSDKPAAPAPRPSDARQPAPSDATAEVVDPLQEETKLLAAAHAELSRGNAAGALVILDQHAAKFPRGTLAPERRATRAMALCKAGRTDEGRRELAALYGADSKSPMAQKIDRACGK